MRHSVTTPGGFFIGLGGIAVSLAVAGAVYCWVKSPATSDDLHPQQLALGLVPAPDASSEARAKKNAEVGELLTAAGLKYNGDNKPDIGKLEDLRGVIRYREAQKSVADAQTVLTAPSSANGADGKPLPVIAAAMGVVAKEIAAKKPAPSTVKVDIAPPAQRVMPPPMPNLQNGGVNTVIFADPNAKPAEAPKPAEPAKPAATEPPKSAAVGTSTALVTASNRAPIFNGSETQK